MKGLCPTQLGQACRIFLAHAYPEGEPSIPPTKRAFLHIARDQPLEPLLTAPVCQLVLTPEGIVRGYAFRLGCSYFPHLKLRADRLEDGDEWVCSVDTHDAVQLPTGHADAERWTQLQAANRRLKEEIERAWEAVGLLTFNDLLRRGLSR